MSQGKGGTKAGAQLGGIRTLDDIMARCWVDEDTGCWHWRGSRKTASGSPSMWLPAIGRASTISQALCLMLKGRQLEKGEHVRWKCVTPYCGNPEHNKFITLSTLRKRQAGKRSATFRAKISFTCRSNSSITDEAIASIRASDLTSQELADIHGISKSYVNKLRAYSRRVPFDAAPQASVFNWRPA